MVPLAIDIPVRRAVAIIFAFVALVAGLEIGARYFFSITPYIAEYGAYAIAQVFVFAAICSDRRFRTGLVVPALSKYRFDDLFFGLTLGLFLWAFSIGLNAVWTYLAAKIDPGFAYRFWNFHPDHRNTLGVIPSQIILFCLAKLLFAPVVEELMFRGALFGALLNRRGLVPSMVISSALFMLLHFHQHYYVSTFIFAVAMCLAYIHTRSLWTAISAHVTFNTTAYLYQGLADVHWTRSMEHLMAARDWMPDWWLLAFSVLGIAGLWKGVVSTQHRDIRIPSPNQT